MKRCTKCGEVQPLDDFGMRADRGRYRPRSWCKACERADALERLHGDPGRQKLGHIKTGDGRGVPPPCPCCEAWPCRPTCLKRCPDCRDLATHPRCRRCEVLVGTHHYEKTMVGDVCGGCASEARQARQPARRERTAA